ncbi:unnamed protein product [Amoebophrya sp. A25]|nr:unnamed protein product [Amoebophrya sp. A25]|eukprot:GSA25T00021036001.1
MAYYAALAPGGGKSGYKGPSSSPPPCSPTEGVYSDKGGSAYYGYDRGGPYGGGGAKHGGENSSKGGDYNKGYDKSYGGGPPSGGTDPWNSGSLIPGGKMGKAHTMGWSSYWGSGTNWKTTKAKTEKDQELEHRKVAHTFTQQRQATERTVVIKRKSGMTDEECVEDAISDLCIAGGYSVPEKVEFLNSSVIYVDFPSESVAKRCCEDLLARTITADGEPIEVVRSVGAAQGVVDKSNINPIIGPAHGGGGGQPPSGKGLGGPGGGQPGPGGLIGPPPGMGGKGSPPGGPMSDPSIGPPGPGGLVPAGGAIGFPAPNGVGGRLANNNNPGGGPAGSPGAPIINPMLSAGIMPKAAPGLAPTKIVAATEHESTDTLCVRNAEEFTEKEIIACFENFVPGAVKGCKIRPVRSHMQPQQKGGGKGKGKTGGKAVSTHANAFVTFQSVSDCRLALSRYQEAGSKIQGRYALAFYGKNQQQVQAMQDNNSALHSAARQATIVEQTIVRELTEKTQQKNEIVKEAVANGANSSMWTEYLKKFNKKQGIDEDASSASEGEGVVALPGGRRLRRRWEQDTSGQDGIWFTKDSDGGVMYFDERNGFFFDSVPVYFEFDRSSYSPAAVPPPKKTKTASSATPPSTPRMRNSVIREIDSRGTVKPGGLILRIRYLPPTFNPGEQHANSCTNTTSSGSARTTSSSGPPGGKHGAVGVVARQPTSSPPTNGNASMAPAIGATSSKGGPPPTSTSNIPPAPAFASGANSIPMGAGPMSRTSSTVQPHPSTSSSGGPPPYQQVGAPPHAPPPGSQHPPSGHAPPPGGKPMMQQGPPHGQHPPPTTSPLHPPQAGPPMMGGAAPQHPPPGQYPPQHPPPGQYPPQQQQQHQNYPPQHQQNYPPHQGAQHPPNQSFSSSGAMASTSTGGGYNQHQQQPPPVKKVIIGGSNPAAPAAKKPLASIHLAAAAAAASAAAAEGVKNSSANNSSKEPDGSFSESEEMEMSTEEVICYLCQRKFRDKAAYKKHCALSELHKQNLALKAEEEGRAVLEGEEQGQGPGEGQVGGDGHGTREAQHPNSYPPAASNPPPAFATGANAQPVVPPAGTGANALPVGGGVPSPNPSPHDVVGYQQHQQPPNNQWVGKGGGSPPMTPWAGPPGQGPPPPGGYNNMQYQDQGASWGAAPVGGTQGGMDNSWSNGPYDNQPSRYGNMGAPGGGPGGNQGRSRYGGTSSGQNYGY